MNHEDRKYYRQRIQIFEKVFKMPVLFGCSFSQVEYGRQVRKSRMYRILDILEKRENPEYLEHIVCQARKVEEASFWLERKDFTLPNLLKDLENVGERKREKTEKILSKI